MIDKSTLLSYYKRKEIQDAIVYAAKDREVAIRFTDFYGKRPETIEYAQDVLEFAKKGATSFHCSEERWSNPHDLTPTSNKKDLDKLRCGWDLVLDIDCALIEYSKITAHHVVDVLTAKGIKNISCKFSGNKGFHIAVPFESFPKKVKGENVEKLFPEAARNIAEYIKSLIKEHVADEILSKDDFSTILEKTNTKKEDIIYKDRNEFGEQIEKLNVEPFLNIDTILISPRHLFRMPYSLHEKSGLASVPIDPKKIMEFEKKNADPKTLKISTMTFLEREKSVEGEATDLFSLSYDYMGVVNVNKIRHEDNTKKFSTSNMLDKDYEEITKEVPEELFPQCIKQLLLGLKDGRKRAVLILINFLSSVGWSHDRITEKLNEWNKLNPEPLKENYIIGQIRHHKQQNKKVLPPNCDNKMYYADLGIKCESCKSKNPVSYVRRKVWILNRQAEEKEQEEAEKTARKENRKIARENEKKEREASKKQ